MTKSVLLPFWGIVDTGSAFAASHGIALVFTLGFPR
nr:MAG TPA: hypothetical protein [Bacteriophage sp.]